jgi:signal transduction histidine kinase
MRKNALPWSLNRTLTTPAETSSILTPLRGRVRWLRHILPAGLLLLVVIYEIGPAYWIHNAFGEQYHFLAEILVYGTVGPVLAFLLLDLLDRWLEERETTEAQAQRLAQIDAHAKISQQLNDDALQMLFAASILLASLKSNWDDMPPDTRYNLLETEQALDRAIQQLRDHLQAQPLS